MDRFDAGFIDYTAFLRALEAGGYDGAVAYEMCSPLRGGGGIDNLDCCARMFLDFLRRAGEGERKSHPAGGAR